MTSRVLKILIDNLQNYVSGSEIGASLGISRVAVGKYIKKLKDDGYAISSITNTGHRLSELPSFVDGQLLSALTSQKVIYHASCESTNTIAREYAVAGGADIIVAGEQILGRGRKGRSFVSGVGGAYFSIITNKLNPPLGIGRAMLISLAAGLAVYETIKQLGVQNLWLKYPNDVLVVGKKICGILTETLSDADYLEWAVTGIGININNTLPEELENTATTLQQILGREVNIASTIADVVIRFGKMIDNIDDIVDRYKSVCPMIGKDVDIIEDKRTYSAKAVDINQDGYLIIESNNKRSYALGCDLSYRQARE